MQGIKTTMKLMATAAVAGCVMMSGNQAASAASFAEPADAGLLPASAADTTIVGAVGAGPSRLDRITGFFGDGDIADLFKIKLDTASNFSALVQGIASTPVNDPQIFLFDQNGVGLFANDDGGGGLIARIQTFLQAGTYYLGISKYDTDPLNSDGIQIFPDTPFSALLPPNVANATLASWGSGSTSGVNYEVILAADAVPTPALLPGLVGLGLGMRRKRKAMNSKKA
jgi:hypothetical protein